MNLFVFICKNATNIWAGIGARRWAVSNADPSVMKGRATRLENVSIGSAGLIYRSDEKAFTTPFIVTSKPDRDGEETNVWPECWRMPFSIHPLGTPRRQWDAHDAASALPFNQEDPSTNISSVFKTVGTAVFSPVVIGDDDWELLLENLADRFAGQ